MNFEAPFDDRSRSRFRVSQASGSAASDAQARRRRAAPRTPAAQGLSSALRLLLGRALEAHRRLAHAARLDVAHAHNARVHGARHAVVVLAVELGEHVHCRVGAAGKGSCEGRRGRGRCETLLRHARSKAEAALRSFSPPASTMLRTMKRPMALSCGDGVGRRGKERSELQSPGSKKSTTPQARPQRAAHLSGLAHAVRAVDQAAVATPMAVAASVSALLRHLRLQGGEAQVSVAPGCGPAPASDANNNKCTLRGIHLLGSSAMGCDHEI